jgi:hypothetical protein
MAKRYKPGDLSRQARRDIINAARNSAKTILNDLAEAGPNWSGDFLNSWVTYAPGVGSGSESGYPYLIKDMPNIPDTYASVNRDVKISISNTAPHAMQAMDLEEGKFISVGDPLGSVVLEGKRVGSGRADINTSVEGTSRATAPADWFVTYVNSTGILEAMGKGVDIAFASSN